MPNQYEILTTTRYYLELSLDGSKDVIDGYFNECSTFKRSQELIEICEVSPQKWGSKGAKCGRVVRTKIPGNSKSDNIVLKLGMSISSTLWNWFKEVESGNWATQRRDGDLTIYTQGNDQGARFRFKGAWPLSYKISDVKAGDGDFQIEELELAVDEFYRVTATTRQA